MFGVPADTAWIWLGLVIASAAMFGIVSDIGAAPPDAERVADTVDHVAASSHTATGTVELDATEVKLGPDRIGLRGPGGTAHETLDFGPVTPVRSNSRLEGVLQGRPPGEVFAIPQSFEYTVEAAQGQDAEWRAAGPTLRVRYVEFGGVSCVLVGT